MWVFWRSGMKCSLFPRLPTIQFLTTCKKWTEERFENRTRLVWCMFVLKVGSCWQFDSCINGQFAITFASNMASVWHCHQLVSRKCVWHCPQQSVACVHCYLLHSSFQHIASADLVSSPDLIRRVYRFQYILKAIRVGVGFGSGTETSADQSTNLHRLMFWG